jgi:hypothetical protein
MTPLGCYWCAGTQAQITNLLALLEHVINLTQAAADLLVSEWEREGGRRGECEKADVDSEIEVFLRAGLLYVF